MAEMSFEPGTKVDLMRSGQWEGPFTVTDRTGRTPEHLVLLNPANGVLFEEHVDKYSIGYQIRPHEVQAVCQCEHALHWQIPLTVHRYLAVPAGESRAMHVGPICDACVAHMTDWLVKEESSGD